MAAVVCDAILSAKHYPGRRISYSRRNAWWQQHSRYLERDFSYYTVVPVIDQLLDAGILTDHDLRPAGRSSGIQSSYTPARWLSDVELPQIRFSVRELIRLKDEEGKLVDFKETAKTHQDRSLLLKINRVLEQAQISLECPAAVHEANAIRFARHTVYPAMTTLYRVYNGSWSLGGRFYGGWWQSCPATARRAIKIDGRNSVELDYAQLHPRLLYGLAGVELNGDAYSIAGWDRKICKTGFNIMLNAPTLASAKAALHYQLHLGADAVDALISEIKGFHPAVADYFHSGIGLRLQNVDSEMCRQVLANMFRRKIIALPIHDSFIVASDHKAELQAAMDGAFSDALRRVKN